MCPRTLNYPLEAWGEGAPSKSKRRKVNVGKSIVGESELCRPSTGGPLEGIGIYIRVIKELVSRLP